MTPSPGAASWPLAAPHPDRDAAAMRAMRRVCLLVGCAAAVAVTACSSPSTSSTSTASLASLQQRYLAAVAPVNTVVATYNAKMAAPNASRADLIAATRAVIDQLDALAATLASIPFPASMSGDVHRVITIAATLTQALRTGTDAEIMQAAADLGAAAATVRSDLQLPVATGSG